MYGENETVFYYLTVMNENYAMPAMPEGRRGRHPQGHLQVPGRAAKKAKAHAQLLGSGAILPR